MWLAVVAGADGAHVHLHVEVESERGAGLEGGARGGYGWWWAMMRKARWKQASLVAIKAHSCLPHLLSWREEPHGSLTLAGLMVVSVKSQASTHQVLASALLTLVPRTRCRQFPIVLDLS